MRRLHVKKFKELLKVYDIKIAELARMIDENPEVLAQILNGEKRYLTQQIIDKVKNITKKPPFEQIIVLYSNKL